MARSLFSFTAFVRSFMSSGDSIPGGLMVSTATS